MNNNKIAFAKILLEKGYTRKQAEIITGLSKSTIQRIAVKSLYKNISPQDYVENAELEERKEVVDTLCLAREIPGAGQLADQDRDYIRLLKAAGVSYEKIRHMYSDRPISEIRNAWQFANQHKGEKFDVSIFGLDQKLVDKMFEI